MTLRTISCGNLARIIAALLIGLAPLVSGCGRRGGLERLPVHGIVSLPNGEKLNGSITFTPMAHENGVAANTSIVDGRYEFSRTDGPTAGPKTVIVKRVVSRKEMLEARKKKRTPADGKLEWTRTAEIASDGDLTRNFDLD